MPLRKIRAEQLKAKHKIKKLLSPFSHYVRTNQIERIRHDEV